MLFAKRQVSVPLGQLVSGPVTNFTRAKVTLREQSGHKTARLDVVEFTNCMEKGSLSVYHLMQGEASTHVKVTEPRRSLFVVGR